MWYFITVLIITSFDDIPSCFVYYSYSFLIPTSTEFFRYIWHRKLKPQYTKNVQCDVRKINTNSHPSLSHNEAQHIFNEQCYCYWSSDPTSPTNIHRFQCGSLHLAQSHQSDNLPPFFWILTSRTHSVGRADDTGLGCSHSSSHPSRRLAPTGN